MILRKRVARKRYEEFILNRLKKAYSKKKINLDWVF